MTPTPKVRAKARRILIFKLRHIYGAARALVARRKAVR
jgi:hypothetical protein